MKGRSKNDMCKNCFNKTSLYKDRVNQTMNRKPERFKMQSSNFWGQLQRMEVMGIWHSQNDYWHGGTPKDVSKVLATEWSTEIFKKSWKICGKMPWQKLRKATFSSWKIHPPCWVCHAALFGPQFGSSGLLSWGVLSRLCMLFACRFRGQFGVKFWSWIFWMKTWWVAVKPACVCGFR